jgi:LmbE family N-acetylglucosaminyl deacetylase
MCILAHPDDESMATGGILARYAAEGVVTSLICATRGEYGWQHKTVANPGPRALGRLREAELRAAAHVLGLHDLVFLDYLDGYVDRADPAEVIGQLVAQLRRLRPDVVVTFDPAGFYGHPDHIAISQYTTAAIVAAADPSYAGPAALPTHRVAKLYYVSPRRDAMVAYQEALGDLVMQIDGVERRATTWNDWAITTQIDTSAYWRQVWQAVSCHRSQLPTYQKLRALPEEEQRYLWGLQTFYRAFSLVNGGRATERDLFEGLRRPVAADSREQQPASIPRSVLVRSPLASYQVG